MVAYFILVVKLMFVLGDFTEVIALQYTLLLLGDTVLAWNIKYNGHTEPLMLSNIHH